MAFDTGTATDYDDLITQIIAFAVSDAGFTDEGSSTLSSFTAYTISKAGFYWTFHGPKSTTTPVGTVNYIDMRMTYSMPSGTFTIAAPTGQPQFTKFTTWANAGPFTGHYLFTNGTEVHCVVEIYSGIFAHLSFGDITKYGTWTGGHYLTASYMIANASGVYSTSSGGDGNGNQYPFDGLHSSNSQFGYVFQDIGGSTNTSFAPLGATQNGNLNARFQISNEQGSIASQDSALNLYNFVMDNSVNSFNFRAPLLPNYLLLKTNAASPIQYRVAGECEYTRCVNMINLDNKQIVDTDWQVFPLSQRTGGDATLAPISANIGIAYKRVA